MRARFALPDREIHDGKWSKMPLRRLAQRYFPEWFVFRKKGWLAGPVADWCSSEDIWGEYVAEIRVNRLSDFMDTAVLEEALAAPEGLAKWSGGNLSLIVAAMNFDLWLSTFIDNDPRDQVQTWMKRSKSMMQSEGAAAR